MKDTARNVIPTNAISKITGFPCYELYVTKSLFLTEGGDDSSYLWGLGKMASLLTPPRARFIAPLQLTLYLHSNFVEHGKVDEEIATLAQCSGHGFVERSHLNTH